MLDETGHFLKANLGSEVKYALILVAVLFMYSTARNVLGLDPADDATSAIKGNLLAALVAVVFLAPVYAVVSLLFIAPYRTQERLSGRLKESEAELETANGKLADALAAVDKAVPAQVTNINVGQGGLVMVTSPDSFKSLQAQAIRLGRGDEGLPIVTDRPANYEVSGVEINGTADDNEAGSERKPSPPETT